MHDTKKTVLLLAMPFAGITLPSIQLSVLEAYCRQRGVTIQTRNLYLKAAEVYGLQNYHALIYPPNDSYTAQMVFSKYVFPDHWKNNEEKIKKDILDFINKEEEKPTPYLPGFPKRNLVDKNKNSYEVNLDDNIVIFSKERDSFKGIDRKSRIPFTVSFRHKNGLFWKKIKDVVYDTMMYNLTLTPIRVFITHFPNSFA